MKYQIILFFFLFYCGLHHIYNYFIGKYDVKIKTIVYQTFVLDRYLITEFANKNNIFIDVDLIRFVILFQ